MTFEEKVEKLRGIIGKGISIWCYNEVEFTDVFSMIGQIEIDEKFKDTYWNFCPIKNEIVYIIVQFGKWFINDETDEKNYNYRAIPYSEFFADNVKDKPLENWTLKEVKEFTKSDIKGGYLVKTQFGDIGIVINTSENEWVLLHKNGNLIFESKDTTDDLFDIDGDSDYNIIEVYGYTTDQCNLFDPSTRELLFKREEIEDLGKKEYVIESIDDENITITPNSSKIGYDDSDDSIYIVIGEEPSNAFTTLSIQSAKDMISALQEIVDYVEGGK